jgi:signal transduction histidine kinase
VIPSAAPEAAARSFDAFGQHRERNLDFVLRASAVLGAIAYVPNVYAAWLDGAMVVVVLDTVVLAIVVALMLARRAPFLLRASVFVTAWYLFAALLVWVVGPIGSGIAWWLGAPVLATLFFGTRAAWWGVAASVLLGVLGGVGFAVDAAQDVPRWAPNGYTAPDWIGTIVSIGVLSALLSLLIVRLMNGLADANRTLQVANERLRAEAEARSRLEQELVEAAEARALASLAGSVAHDLNNLLVPLLAAGTDARDAALPGTVERRRLDLVVASAERARVLARRVLVFRPDARPDRSPVAVGSVVRDAASLLEAAAAPGVRVRVEVEDEVEVVATAGELHQVVMNLGTNALRAVAARQGRVALRVARDGAEALVEVTDDGVGIPAELHERVFDPSFTGHGDVGGTGLGLAIVRHVVRSLGGRVVVRSEVGRGSAFEVRLPLAAA